MLPHKDTQCCEWCGRPCEGVSYGELTLCCYDCIRGHHRTCLAEGYFPIAPSSSEEEQTVHTLILLRDL